MVTKTQIEYNCLRGKLFQRELSGFLQTLSLGTARKPGMGLLGEPHFPVSGSAACKGSSPSPCGLMILNTFTASNGASNQNTKAVSPPVLCNQIKCSDPFFFLSRVFGVIAEAWQGRGGEGTSVVSLGIRGWVAVCC